VALSSVLNSFGAPCAWAPASIDRRARPHKFWAFTNLECLVRSLGPLYLISACFALIEVKGALCHLRMHLWMCLELLLTNEEGGRWECDGDGGCSYGCLIYCHLTRLSALLPSLCIQHSRSLSFGGFLASWTVEFRACKDPLFAGRDAPRYAACQLSHGLWQGPLGSRKLKAKRLQIRKDAEPRVKEKRRKSKPKTRSTPPTSS